MNRISLKNKAKDQIRGKIGAFIILIILILVVVAVSSLLAAVPVFGLLLTVVVAAVIMLSVAKIFLNLTAKNKAPEPKDLLYATDSNIILPAIIAYLRYTVFTFLWSLLFVIPGIIKSISYSQMFFLMADDPKLTAGAAQKKSMDMMEGHKWEYFVLILSFIPWYLLETITCGIATIYVFPYEQATFANFYLNLKKSK